MVELFETDYDEMVAASWLVEGEAPQDEPKPTEELTQCIGKVCMNCDERYLYT